MANKAKVSVNVEFDRATKNTILFKEKVESQLDVETLGQIYIPKTTLKAIGYAEGKRVLVELSVVD